MIDRESAHRSRTSENAADSSDTPIGISKKTIVYLVILVLIAVLCATYVMQIKKARSTGATSAETVTVSATASTAATAEAATTEEPAAEEQPAGEDASKTPEKPAAE